MALVLVLSLVLAIAGCGSKTNDTKPTTDTSGGKTITEDNSKKKEAPVKLKWYTIGTPQKDEQVVEEALNAYLLEKINATVDIVMFDWGEYDKKMQVKIGSSEEFDLMYTCSWANDYVTNVGRGALYPLKDLIEKYGPEIKNNIHPMYLEGATIDGEIYAIPSNKELGAQTMYIINKDLVDKYDIDISQITTMESLEPILAMIKEKEPTFTPMLNKAQVLGFDQILRCFAIDTEGDQGKIVNIYETERAKEAFRTHHKYYKAGYIHPDAAVNETTDISKKGEFFVTTAGYQPYAEILWNQNNWPNNEITIRPVFDPPVINTGSTRGAMQGISITSKHPEKAMEFLNLLYTDEFVINTIDYGVEDVHYTKLDHPYIKQLPRANEGWAFPAFSVGNLQNTYLYEGTPADKWEKFEEYNNGSKKLPSLGFTPDISNIKTELAAIKNVIEEVQKPLYYGVVDPDEYLPKVIDKFKKAGQEKVIADLQKQFNAWKANK